MSQHWGTGGGWGCSAPKVPPTSQRRLFNELLQKRFNIIQIYTFKMDQKMVGLKWKNIDLSFLVKKKCDLPSKLAVLCKAQVILNYLFVLLFHLWLFLRSSSANEQMLISCYWGNRFVILTGRKSTKAVLWISNLMKWFGVKQLLI